ncbi:metallophosphoesterase family protein [Sphingopyxis sp.]|uniref:metallophosphoesterase family protein n=1 Tax=Sphingopyxis sp. TaxID=1908224 RepID=UPI003BA91499
MQRGRLDPGGWVGHRRDEYPPLLILQWFINPDYIASMSFLGLFKRRPAEASRRPPAVPPGERIYAIGDIHGRDDLFARLIEKIEVDNDSRPAARTTLILLGDLVDRGPDSDRVVERARMLSAPFDEVRLLIGNHEECFLGALGGDEKRVRYFVRIGGDATIRSYWRDDAAYDEADFEALAEKLPMLVPQQHIDFLGGGEDMIAIGDYVFVHAGVRPGVPLDRQSLPDLRWIREDFLQETADFGAVVVYGHTIGDEVDRKPNRIGIDTGAYSSGVLTAIGLEATQQWFLDTRD